MPAISFPARPDHHPEIYAYEDKNPDHKGLLKVGFTTIGVEKRVAQQFPVIQPGEGKPYKIVFAESAMRQDGSSFMDHEVHKRLAAHGLECVGGEWYRCTADDVRNAWLEVRDRKNYGKQRVADFPMRPEQQAAVIRTSEYFQEMEAQGIQSPKFLWNAKMRFGKTFATYQLARHMGFDRVLVLTFKPAVKTAWRDDLLTHKNYVGWAYANNALVVHSGQCNDYNGAVCEMLNYLGYDARLIIGYYGRQGNQHYWTEVTLGGKVYVIECGITGYWETDSNGKSVYNTYVNFPNDCTTYERSPQFIRNSHAA